MKKKALITGITGQDGSYLAEFLLKKGYEVYGLVRRTSNDPLVRLEAVRNQIKIFYGNLRDSGSLEQALMNSRPDEIYNLASQSDVGISFSCPDETWEINCFGLGRLLQKVLDLELSAKIYQASTSEMFGNTPPPQNEKSPFKPVSPYAKAKLSAHEDYVVGYRRRFGLYIVSGFLFNHESPRRGEHFVTRKITLSLAKIQNGLQDYLELGNLDARRDWGFAGDYIEAMWLMLQQNDPVPEDFVVATGQNHTVKEFVETAAGIIGLNIHWRGEKEQEVGIDQFGKLRVRVNPKFYRPLEVNYLLGDTSKIERCLGWKPKTSFYQLVAMMMETDMKLICRTVR